MTTKLTLAELATMSDADLTRLLLDHDPSIVDILLDAWEGEEGEEPELFDME